MKEAFIDKRFTKQSLKTLDTVVAIVSEYRRQGYDLSVRQLYYQLVARGHIANNLKTYKRIANLVNDGRLAGLIDWSMIADRHRSTISPSTWSDLSGFLDDVVDAFKIDIWAYQPNHVEVMVEKDALTGVLLPVCRALGVPFTPLKGYGSSSLLYDMGKRFARARAQSKTVWVIHLGDHDPSGIDMTRDLDDRLNLFTGGPVMVKRIALNIDQVEALKPPENPAKTTDSRFLDYRRRFGSSSWELDAIEPVALADLVRQAVDDLILHDVWNQTVAHEESLRADLVDLAGNYRSD